MKNTFENFDLDSSLDFLDKIKDISTFNVRSVPGKKFKKVHSKSVKPSVK